MLPLIAGIFGAWTIASTVVVHLADEENKKLALKPVRDYIDSHKNPPELDKELTNEGRLAIYAADNDNVLLENAIERGDTKKVRVLIESYYVKERIFEKDKYGEYDNYFKLLDLAIRKKRADIVVVLLNLNPGRYIDKCPVFQPVLSEHELAQGYNYSNPLLWKYDVDNNVYWATVKLYEAFMILAQHGSSETLRAIVNSDPTFYIFIDRSCYLENLLTAAMGRYSNYVVNYEIVEEIIKILVRTELLDQHLEVLTSFAKIAIECNNVRVTKLLLESGLINFDSTIMEPWLEDGWKWGSLKSCLNVVNILIQYQRIRRYLGENIEQVLYHIVPINFLKWLDKSDDDITSEVKKEASCQWKHDEWIKEQVESRIKKRNSSLAIIQAEVDEFLGVILQCDAVLSALFRIGRQNIIFQDVNILEASYYGPCLAKVKEIYDLHEIVNNPANRNFQSISSVMDRVSPVLLWHYIGGRYRVCLDSFFISRGCLPVKLYRDKILKHPKWLEWKEIIETFILCMNRKVDLRDKNIASVPSELIRIVSLHGACQTFDAPYGWPAEMHFPLLKALHSVGNARYAKVDKLFRVK